jgi:pimeloyl-ACP methyl ester carboxylesterase
MKLVWIHGLNSSYRSFNYLADKVAPDASVMVSYDSHRALDASIAKVAAQLPEGEDYVLVGHSLGGVIALNLVLEGLAAPVKVITISSPLGGSKAASALRWFARDMEVLADITPSSHYIRALQVAKPRCPVVSIISTAGSLPLSPEPNDSVVTVASQKALAYGRKIEVRANHFEVLCHEHTLRHLKELVT